jgi:hypothetical protein
VVAFAGRREETRAFSLAEATARFAARWIFFAARLTFEAAFPITDSTARTALRMGFLTFFSALFAALFFATGVLTGVAFPAALAALPAFFGPGFPAPRLPAGFARLFPGLELPFRLLAIACSPFSTASLPSARDVEP